MSETNWQALATELADVQRRMDTVIDIPWGEWGTLILNRRSLVEQIIAAATPEPKPAKWPGIDGEAKVVHEAGGSFVSQNQTERGWYIYSPVCATGAAAVAEWNRVASLSGGVDEQIRAMAEEIDRIYAECAENDDGRCATVAIIRRHLQAAGGDDRLTRAAGLLRKSRRTHYYCEDTWYSCPKAEGGCANPRDGTKCNCGADEWNQKIDALLASLPAPPHDEQILCMRCGLSINPDCRVCGGTGFRDPPHKAVLHALRAAAEAFGGHDEQTKGD